jgi:hypothetical protein
MAQPTAAITTKSKDHRRRKNPRSADIFAAERKARNAKRPKQRWVEAAIDTGKDTSPIEGYWTREAV